MSAPPCGAYRRIADERRAVDLVLAYIDPGSGSLILQAVIAAAAAVPFFFRTQIRRAARQVRTIVRREPAAASQADDRARG